MGAVVLAATWSAGLAGCGSGEERAGAPVATSVVEMPRHYRFDPPVIVVPEGTAVLWRNTDDFTHSVRILGEGGAYRDVPPGDSARIVFPEAGEYPYECTYHAQMMRGKVIVAPAG